MDNTIEYIMATLSQPEYSFTVHKFGLPEGYGYGNNKVFNVTIKYINPNKDVLEVKRHNSDFGLALDEAFKAIQQGMYSGVRPALTPPTINHESDDIPF